MGTKTIIIVGGIGKNERQNRDRYRVMDRRGQSVTICSHDAQEPPLAVKKYDKENHYKRSNG
jgi:hypothetical protein